MRDPHCAFPLRCSCGVVTFFMVLTIFANKLGHSQAFADANPTVLPFVAVSTGTSEKDITKLKGILEAAPGITLICMDVANGYSEHFSAAVRNVRAAHPTHTIIAGNVVTGEMVEQLLLDGADIIKVGIGPGSVCTTRKQTGVGYPQLSAVIECADAAHGMGGHVMADGGCTCPGDIAKAFGAGADYVMCGGMFAGHECVRPRRPCLLRWYLSRVSCVCLLVPACLRAFVRFLIC